MKARNAALLYTANARLIAISFGLNLLRVLAKQVL
jgi:hypothetical protein